MVYSGQGVELTTCVSLVLRLLMHEALRVFTHTHLRGVVFN